MALSQPAPPERQNSPLLSNNPFRNRIASPTSKPSSPLVSTPTERRSTTNPFLDASEQQTSLIMDSPKRSNSPTKDGATAQTTELLGDMSLNNKVPPPPYSKNGSDTRNENVPPRSNGGGPPRHGSTRSAGEDERRRMGGPRPRGPPGPRNIFDDPPQRRRSRERRHRRNSDSSAMERSSRLLDPEDEKRRRERRRREERHRDGKHKGKRPNKKMDVIDKLDVTSIYGTGLFHHDGPFDACNPSRNRKGSRNAPMQAFPKDSRNMAIGGSGPNNSRLDLNVIHGNTEQGYNDFSNTAGDDFGGLNNAARPWNPERSESYGFNSHMKSEPIHGDESMGLGTSTFLEGAPASRTAIQQHQLETDAAIAAINGPGLGRKKSLAQKIRGISNNRPVLRNNGAISPDSYQLERTMSPSSPRANGTPNSTKNENNPFFKDYDQEYEKKGAQIQSQEEKIAGRARAPSSPVRVNFERRGTNEGMAGDEGKTGGGAVGFLSRVKSLRGGPKKPRVERRETAS